MASLHTKYLGLDLKSPIVAASSGLTESLDGLKKFEDAGAGAVVLKSLFEEEILLEMKKSTAKMSAQQFIYPETVGYYEDNDQDMLTVENYLKLLTDAKKSLNIPVIPSINCITAEEWLHFPKTLESAGADALELNIFILPSDLNRTAKENEQVYFDILKEVKSSVSIPVAVKLSSYFSHLAQMLQKLDKAGADALVLFNKFYSPDFDIDNFEITNGNVLSAASDMATSLRWVSIMSNRLNCDVAASTGIADGSAVVKQLLAGADVVQAASAFYKHGIPYLSDMNDALEEWMDAKDFKTIADFKGKMSQDQSKNPAAYERVQFMKHFRGYSV